MSHQAIITKFLGPTNFRGSRVKASADAGSKTVGWDYGAGNATAQTDVEANHDRAAIALVRELEWFGTWVRGSTDDGFVYVCAMRQKEGQGHRTPHPQSVSPIHTLFIREEK